MATPRQYEHEQATVGQGQQAPVVLPQRRAAALDPAPVIDAGRLARLPRGLGDQLRRTHNI
ncbi:hypothetical protein ACFYXS_17520 [Streptomyces sp. NPDC002574]|uniref:hypothetical protein n=1 Tax=Streptomyces sp. NPDC002574 TaxID=3364652 RepID=UPI0036CFED8A